MEEILHWLVTIGNYMKHCKSWDCNGINQLIQDVFHPQYVDRIRDFMGESLMNHTYQYIGIIVVKFGIALKCETREHHPF